MANTQLICIDRITKDRNHLLATFLSTCLFAFFKESIIKLKSKCNEIDEDIKCC